MNRRGWMSVLVVLTHWFCLHGDSSVSAQGNAQYPNDPSIVRQPAYNLQPPGANSNRNQIVTQPDGQRVFLPNADSAPNNPPSSASPGPRPFAPVPQGDVRTASWTVESPTTPADESRSAKARSSIELKAPSNNQTSEVTKPKSSWNTLLSMFLSLTIVVCLFLCMAWVAKKAQPNSFAKLPGEVVQVMGRTPMAPRQQMYVVRFGTKLLLISHQPGQTQTLGEITDIDEVQRLAGLCEANQPHSVTSSFRDVLKQVALGRPESEPKSAYRSRRVST